MNTSAIMAIKPKTPSQHMAESSNSVLALIGALSHILRGGVTFLVALCCWTVENNAACVPIGELYPAKMPIARLPLNYE